MIHRFVVGEKYLTIIKNQLIGDAYFLLERHTRQRETHSTPPRISKVRQYTLFQCCPYCLPIRTITSFFDMFSQMRISLYDWDELNKDPAILKRSRVSSRLGGDT